MCFTGHITFWITSNQCIEWDDILLPISTNTFQAPGILPHFAYMYTNALATVRFSYLLSTIDFTETVSLPKQTHQTAFHLLPYQTNMNISFDLKKAIDLDTEQWTWQSKLELFNSRINPMASFRLPISKSHSITVPESILFSSVHQSGASSHGSWRQWFRSWDAEEAPTLSFPRIGRAKKPTDGDLNSKQEEKRRDLPL